MNGRRKKNTRRSNQQIAVVGMSCRFSDAENYVAFWNNLVKGKNSISEIEEKRFDKNNYYSKDISMPDTTVSKWCGQIADVDKFDNGFFNISPREAKNMDPQQRILLEEVWHCIEDASIPLKELQKGNTSVYVGVMSNDYEQKLCYHKEEIDSYTFLGNCPAILANRISYCFNFSGCSETINAACASSAVAIHNARKSILSGESDFALVAGVNLNLFHEKYISFSKSGMLSREGQCKFFDEEADGYVPGDGVGVILLMPLERALQENFHIWGLLKGSAVNHNGKTKSITAPSVAAQVDVIKNAYNDAGILPLEVNYIETHGTGTSLGDPIEIEALKQIYDGIKREDLECYLGSVKTNVGHTEAAAGICSIIKVLLMMHHKTLVPTINYVKKNPIINLDNTPFKLCVENTKWNTCGRRRTRKAGVSSFGFGGVNAHIILEEFQTVSVQKEEKSRLIKDCLFVLSADSKESLNETILEWKKYMDTEEFADLEVEEICKNLLYGRKHCRYRSGIKIYSKEELKNKIQEMVIDHTSHVEVEWNIQLRELEMEQSLSLHNQMKKVETFQNYFHSADEYVRQDELVRITKGERTYEKMEKVFSILTIYAFVRTMIDMGVPVHAVSDRTEDKLLSLLICGLINIFDAMDIILGKKTIGQCTIETLHIPYYSMTEKKCIVQYTYFKDSYQLVKYFKTSEFKEKREIIIEFFIKVKALMENQYSFKRAVSEWNVELNAFAFTVEQIVDDFLEEKEGGTGIYWKLAYFLLLREYEFLLEKWNIQSDISKIDDTLSILLILYNSGIMQKRDLIMLAMEKKGTEKHFYDMLERVGENPVIRSKLSRYITLSKEEKDKLVEHILKDQAKDVDVELPALWNLEEDIFDKILATWKQGVDLNWEVLYGSEYRKYRLPKYAFHGNTFWLKNVEKDKGKEENVTLYSYNWVPKECSVAEEKKVIVFLVASDFKWKEQIKELAIERSIGIELVEYEPGMSEQSEQIFLQFCLQYEKHKSEPVLGVFLDACCTDEETRMKCGERFSFFFHFIKNHMKHPDIKAGFLHIFLAEDELPYPEMEALAPMFSSLHMENNRVYYKNIELRVGYELTKDAFKKELSDILSKEDVRDGNFEVKYSNQKRYEKVLTKTLEHKNIRLPLKQKGVYIITGALGKLGTALTEFLENEYDAKMVLIGRRELTEEEQKKLEQNKSYVRCNLNDETDVQRVIDFCIAKYGKINGIFHCAGKLDNHFLYNKEIKNSLSVLEPKVTGIINLDQATKSLDLDFLLVYSSIVGLFGDIGSFDYAYANHYVNAFCKYRNQLVSTGKRFGNTIAIQWPLWLTGGMQAENSSVLFQEETKGNMLPQADGLRALQSIVDQGITECLVWYGEQNLQNVLEKLKKSAIDVLKQKECVSVEKNNISSKEATISYLTKLLSELTEYPAEELKLEEPFETFGVDSFIIHQFNERVSEFIPDISRTLLYEYGNLLELSGYFLERYPEKMRELEGTTWVGETRKEQVEGQNTMEEVKVQRIDDNDIAIIGLAGIYPGADTLDQLWKNLVFGKDSVTNVPEGRWDMDSFDEKTAKTVYCTNGGFLEGVQYFDPLFFKLSPKQAEEMDPQERLMLETVWHTFEDAGYGALALNPVQKNIGVYVGATTFSYSKIGQEEWQKGGKDVPNSLGWSIANRISYTFNLTGPSMNIDTACSSSLVALHNAVTSLQNRECELALVGSVNLFLHPYDYAYRCKLHMLSDSGKCHTFGAGADGYVPGEGVGAVLLKPLDAAIKDQDHIWGVIKGTAVNHGGKVNGYTVPNPNAQAKVIKEALQKTGWSPEQIGYIEAHGTGTALGDPIEITGLTKAFDTSDINYCAIGSVKTNIGHLEGAAGIAGITKILLQMRHKKLIPSLHAEELNNDILFEKTPFTVQKKYEDWKPIKGTRKAGVSAFGAGGTNAHIMIEEFEPKEQPEVEEHKTYLVPFSAKCKESLQGYIQEMIQFLENENSGNRSEEILDKGLEILEELVGLDKSEFSMFIRLSEYGIGTFELRELADRLVSKTDWKMSEQCMIDTEMSFLQLIQAIFYKDRQIGLEQRSICDKKIRLCDLAYTLQKKRAYMDNRIVFVVSCIDELKQEMQNFIDGKAGCYAYGNIETQKEDVVTNISMDQTINQIVNQWLSVEKAEFPTWNRNEATLINLPGYKFRKVSCWIKNVEIPVKQKAVVGDRHMLKVLPEKCLGDGLVYEVTLQSRMSFIQQHVVSKEYVLPGCGYLSIVRELFKELGLGKAQIDFLNVFWLKALLVEEESKVLLRLRKEDIHYWFSFEDMNETFTYAKGEVIVKEKENPELPGVFPLAEIKQYMPNHIETKQFYQHFEDNQIVYGDYFKRVQDIFAGEEEAVCYLSETEQEDEDSLFTGMLDAILQTTQFQACSRNQTGIPMLPFSIGKMEIFGSLAKSAACYTKMIGNGTYDIAVVNQQEEIIAILYDVSLLQQKDPLNRFFYVPEWRKIELETKQRKENTSPVLIIRNKTKLAERVTELLKEKCKNVNVQEYILKDENDFIEVLSKQREINTVYFLGGLTDKEFDIQKPKQFKQAKRDGIEACFELTKALIALYENEKIELHIASNNVESVFEEDYICPVSAVLSGFTRSLAKEYKNWDVTQWDICYEDLFQDWTETYSKSVIDCLIEKEIPSKEYAYAVRKGCVYSQGLKAIHIAKDSGYEYRKEGIYVIFGGMGGIGYSYACYLAKQANAKVILVGRRALNYNIEKKLEQINYLSGQKPEYYSCDICDEENMRELGNLLKKQYGTINGVIHSALVLKDQAIQNMTLESLEEVLGPKVEGSINILKFSQYFTELDFILFFSGAQSMLGYEGQSNYAAGCYFKDRLAVYVSQMVSYPVKVVNWGYWGSVGVVSSESYGKKLKRKGLDSVEPEVGMEAIRRIQGSTYSQVYALHVKGEAVELLHIESVKEERLQADYQASLRVQVFEGREMKGDLEQFREFRDSYGELNGFAVRLILKALRSCGILKEEGEVYTFQELVRSCKVVSCNIRAFKAILDILAEEEILKYQNAEIHTTNNIVDYQEDTMENLERLREVLLEKYENIEPQIVLLYECGKKLMEILNGSVLATDVIFPNASMKLVSGVYGGSYLINYYNGIVAKVIQTFLESRNTDRTIRILEIGSGTGGTSKVIFDLLNAGHWDVEYVYTDISGAFLNHGRETFGRTNSYISFKIFNIEKFVEEESEFYGYFDLAVATNVLHATSDIHFTIGNLKRVLKPYGWCLVNEATNVISLNTLTFGMLKGWWEFTDEEIRLTNAPLLSVERWKRLLATEGFEHVQVLGDNRGEWYWPQQNVFVAESDGIVKKELKGREAWNAELEVHEKKETKHYEKLEPQIQEKQKLHKKPDSEILQIQESKSVVKKKSQTLEEIKNTVIDCISRILEIEADEISVTKPFLDYGVDSIIGIELIQDINKQLNRKLRTTTLFDYANINTFTNYIFETQQ